MVLLPGTQQAVLLLMSAKSDLPPRARSGCEVLKQSQSQAL